MSKATSEVQGYFVDLAWTLKEGISWTMYRDCDRCVSVHINGRETEQFVLRCHRNGIDVYFYAPANGQVRTRLVHTSKTGRVSQVDDKYIEGLSARARVERRELLYKAIVAKIEGREVA